MNDASHAHRARRNLGWARTTLWLAVVLCVPCDGNAQRLQRVTLAASRADPGPLALWRIGASSAEPQDTLTLRERRVRFRRATALIGAVAWVAWETQQPEPDAFFPKGRYVLVFLAGGAAGDALGRLLGLLVVR